MRLMRIFSGLAPALAVAALIGFAAPVASYAQNAPATTAAPAAAPAAARRSACGQARPARDPGLRRGQRRCP